MASLLGVHIDSSELTAALTDLKRRVKQVEEYCLKLEDGMKGYNSGVESVEALLKELCSAQKVQRADFQDFKNEALTRGNLGDLITDALISISNSKKAPPLMAQVNAATSAVDFLRDLVARTLRLFSVHPRDLERYTKPCAGKDTMAMLEEEENPMLLRSKVQYILSLPAFQEIEGRADTTSRTFQKRLARIEGDLEAKAGSFELENLKRNTTRSESHLRVVTIQHEERIKALEKAAAAQKESRSTGGVAAAEVLEMRISLQHEMADLAKKVDLLAKSHEGLKEQVDAGLSSLPSGPLGRLQRTVRALSKRRKQSSPNGNSDMLRCSGDLTTSGEMAVSSSDFTADISSVDGAESAGGPVQGHDSRITLQRRSTSLAGCAHAGGDEGADGCDDQGRAAGGRVKGRAARARSPQHGSPNGKGRKGPRGEGLGKTEQREPVSRSPEQRKPKSRSPSPPRTEPHRASPHTIPKSPTKDRHARRQVSPKFKASCAVSSEVVEAAGREGDGDCGEGAAENAAELAPKLSVSTLRLGGEGDNVQLSKVNTSYEDFWVSTTAYDKGTARQVYLSYVQSPGKQGKNKSLSVRPAPARPRTSSAAKKRLPTYAITREESLIAKQARDEAW